MSSPPPVSAPIIWALAAEVAGMKAQAEGLADELARLANGNAVPVRAALPAAAKLLPPALARFFAAATTAPTPAAAAADTPHIAIGCGSAGQAAALAAKQRHNAYAVCVQRPSGSAQHFDAIIAPQHDYRAAPPPANVLTTLGAVGKITPDALASRRTAARARFPAPLQIAVLIGGSNRAYTLHAETLVTQLQRVAALSNAALLITPSRRTPPAVTQQLRQRFPAPHFVWDGSGDNPYEDILAAADGYCITADSVNMISEACAAGRATYLLPLQQREGARAARAAQKFTTFHDSLIQRGNLRRFEDDWQFFTADPLAETAAAAARLWEMWQQTTTAPRHAV